MKGGSSFLVALPNVLVGQIVLAADFKASSLCLVTFTMVSQDFPKESASNFLRQCLGPDMDSEDYSMQFQSNGVPLSPLMEQMFRTENTGMVTRCLMNCQAQEENARRGFNYVDGKGLSLTLGSRLSSALQKGRQVNALCSNYASKDCNTICEGETNGRVHNYTHAFHGMSPVVSALQNSRYMKPAQQLLDEAVCVSNAVERRLDNQVRESIVRSGRKSYMGERAIEQEGQCLSEEKQDVQIRITKLSSLLNELEIRYENYFYEMDMVVSSFEAVAGIGAAASYTALTVQAMSKHFSNLRDAIIVQLKASRDLLSEDPPRNHGDTLGQKVVNRKKRGTLHHLGMIQMRQVWRPLRGLPDDSVALLRAWLFEHFLHPYPSDNEKLMLASQTGLTRNQISNWFINARVRLWKPMIEEMYREEFAEDTQESEPSSEL